MAGKITPMPALYWLIAAVALAVGETLSGDLILIMIAGGALGGSAAAAFGAPLWLQGVVFAVVALALLAGVRPVVKRQLLGSTGHAATNVEALTGREARVTSAIGTETGLVSIDGDEWTARALMQGQQFAVGEKVWVHDIDGATAVVIKQYDQ